MAKRTIVSFGDRFFHSTLEKSISTAWALAVHQPWQSRAAARQARRGIGRLILVPVAVFVTRSHVPATLPCSREPGVGVAHQETRELLANTTSTLDRLTELAYHELRTIAHRHLAARGQRGAHGTLETTALVHEAYLKLSSASPGAWRDETHFRAVASVAMRQILVDRARARTTTKHGGGLTRVSLDETAIAVDDEPDMLLAIDAALTRLAELSPRLARLVELRFYGGLSEAEAAAELGVNVRTVQRDWSKARMLLERLVES